MRIGRETKPIKNCICVASDAKLQHSRHQFYFQKLSTSALSKSPISESPCNQWRVISATSESQELQHIAAYRRVLCQDLDWKRIHNLDTGLLWIQHHLQRKVPQLIRSLDENPVDTGIEDLAERERDEANHEYLVSEKDGRHLKALRWRG